MKPRLAFARGYFIFHADKDDRKLAREAGFIWSEKHQRYYTETPKVAARLREYADASAKRELSRLFIRFSPWLGPLPHPGGLTPKNYQLESAAFSLSRSRSYLALDPGLGKTPIAAIVRNALDARALIVTPPFLTRNTEIEFSKWSTGRPRIERFDHLSSIFTPEILIVPDSILSRPEVALTVKVFAERARADKKRLILISDEVHRYKNDEAGRTKAFFEFVAPYFPRQLYLSGTPIPNARPMELYSILSNAAPETIDFRSKHDFGLRYCDAKEKIETCKTCHGKRVDRRGLKCRYCRGTGGFSNGVDYNGVSNLAELKERVQGPFMLRLRKADVLKELPPKTEEIVVIGDGPARLLKMERELLKQIPETDLMAEKVSSDHVSVYRRELGAYKVNASLDFIRSLLEDTEEAILIYAFHTEVIAALAKGLQGFDPLIITGKTLMKDRQRIVETFQGESLGKRLLIANYATAVGYTATKASRVVFVEYSWVRDENVQATDRSHRIGQTAHVFCQYLCFQNSIDRKVIETNLRKRSISDQF